MAFKNEKHAGVCVNDHNSNALAQQLHLFAAPHATVLQRQAVSENNKLCDYEV